MGFINNVSVLIALVLTATNALAVDDPLHPTYPTIPSSYTELDPGSLINDARVNFGFEPEVKNTDGYKVTSPDGDTFYVDNVEQPSCAFYATYVSNDDEDSGSSGGLEVFSNVYIEEVNFENCQ